LERIWSAALKGSPRFGGLDETRLRLLRGYFLPVVSIHGRSDVELEAAILSDPRLGIVRSLYEQGGASSAEALILAEKETSGREDIYRKLKERPGGERAAF